MAAILSKGAWVKKQRQITTVMQTPDFNQDLMKSLDIPFNSITNFDCRQVSNIRCTLLGN